MATTIFTPQITLPNEVCDSIEVPRGTQITLSRDLIEQHMLIAIPDDLCDFIEVPRDTKMPRSEIERIGKKYVRDNIHFIEASWDKLIFNKDFLAITYEEEAKLTKLFRLRALIKPETYPLPKELCNLLEIPVGLPMNRFDLENQVNEYIRACKLMKNNMVNLSEGNRGKNLRKVFALREGTQTINQYDMVMGIMNYFVEKVQLANTLKGEFKEVAFAISDELADFLKVAHGTKMSITDAVLSVAKYTYENDLQIWDSKKNSFTLDANLRTLFSLSDEALELTYDALFEHVKKHFGVKKYDLNTPLAIPVELCDFFQVPHGTQMSEIDVIHKLNVYIRENNLQNREHHVTFIPDEKMRTLFAIPETIREINYYEIRGYIGVYFAGKVAYPASNQDPSKSVPIAISDELCDFFQVPRGTKMSKIDAILGIAKYTWDHALLIGKNDYFTANDQLVKLFDLEIGDEDHAEERKITYDRIENLLSKHFVGSA